MQAMHSIRFNTLLLLGLASAGTLISPASFAQDTNIPTVSISEIVTTTETSPEETSEIPTEVPLEDSGTITPQPEKPAPTEVMPIPEVPEVDSEAAAPMETSTMTIVEIAGSSDAFEILTMALESAELTDELSSEGPFTVFAPTDEAFAELPEGMLEALLLPENQELLVQILTYHVLPDTLLSGDMVEGETATLEGSNVMFTSLDETLQVNEATVLLADVEAQNGIIHVIDQVILPPALAAELPTTGSTNVVEPTSNSPEATATGGVPESDTNADL